jgi:gamma-glutamyltranspeptidase/glutathione hydrolase
MWTDHTALQLTATRARVSLSHETLWRMRIMIRTLRIVAASAALALAVAPAAAQEPIYSNMDRIHPVYAEHGMVASQEAVATEVGLDILKAGGNAVDAAVAVGFALAVTLPSAGNLGGGGFMLVHLADSGETLAIDYREKAPAKAHRDMYLDSEGNADSNLSRFTPLAIGVPGTVAGLTLALERYGTMSLDEVMAPAIRLAEEGVTVSAELSESLSRARRSCRRISPTR